MRGWEEIDALTPPANYGAEDDVMDFDSEGLEVLSRDECVELMKSVPIGRIVFTHQALPAIRPVAFSVADEGVLIPTAADSRIATAAQDAIVAFQTDAFDISARSGWSVTVIGHAQLVRGMAGTGHPSWVLTCCENHIRIGLEQVSGRRILTACAG